MMKKMMIMDKKEEGRVMDERERKSERERERKKERVRERESKQNVNILNFPPSSPPSLSSFTLILPHFLPYSKLTLFSPYTLTPIP